MSHHLKNVKSIFLKQKFNKGLKLRDFKIYGPIIWKSENRRTKTVIKLKKFQLVYSINCANILNKNKNLMNDILFSENKKFNYEQKDNCIN
jgi:hypothetical protein